MPPMPSNPENLRSADRNGAAAAALTALAWTLADHSRAQRLLDLTGLTAEGLRAGAGDAEVLAAVLDFLAAHEPDLVACAKETGFTPAELIRARDILQA